MGHLVHNRLTRNLLAEAVMIAGLLAPVLYYFRGTIGQGLIAYENDTRVFYYPVFAYAANRLRSGELPLWVPELFGGFPLFADGEAGMLYPLHLLAMLLLPVDTAFLWLQPLRFFQSALFMYLFCRTMGTGRFGALVGGIAFNLSGFAIAQIHHTNISTAIIWLPLILAFTELGLRRPGPRRLLCFLLAGVALAVQSLTIHVQVTMMSATAFVTFALYRSLVGPVPAPGGLTPRPPLHRGWRGGSPPEADGGEAQSPTLARRILDRLVLAVIAIVLPAGVGLGLAGVQLLPLAELGQFSARGGGVEYGFATQYSLPPLHLISLLFPDFFVADGIYWGVWSRWEIHPYVGIAPLVLAVLAVVLARNRYTMFFLGLSLVGLNIAFGDRSYFGLHEWLSQWPGFNVLRAPGRFVYLFSFGMAVLAAHGAGYLARELRWQPPGTVPPLVRQLNAVLLVAVLLLLQLAAMAVPLALSAVSTFITANKEAAIRLLARFYLPLSGLDPRYTVEHFYLYVRAALDLAQPSTIRQVVLLLLVVSLVLLWEKLRLLALFWQAALVLTLAVDLIVNAATFHPVAPLRELMAPSGAERFLAAQPGLFRAYTWRGFRDEPNRLLRLGLADANGYSSLQMVRHAAYVNHAERAENPLFDVWNVRYLVRPNRFQPLPAFELTSYNPDRPLASSTGRNAAATVRFRLQDVAADRVRLISTLRWAMTVPQGTTVARLVVTAVGGERQTFPVQAGVHTAEWAWDRPDYRGKVRHQQPRIAYTWEQEEGSNASFPAHFYYAEFRLGAVRHIRQVALRFVHPTAQVQVFGLSLFNTQTQRREQVNPLANAKYRQVYSDAEAVVYENLAVLPRAYLVPSAVVLRPDELALRRMESGDFQPERAVLLEEPLDVQRLSTSVGADREGYPPVTISRDGWRSTSGAGMATITSYQPERVVVDVVARQNAMLFLADTYYPGWYAYLDGREIPIYRANYLFRSIYVPAGTHTIEFRYAPRSFRLGAVLSLVTGLVVIVAIARSATWHRG